MRQKQGIIIEIVQMHEAGSNLIEENLPFGIFDYLIYSITNYEHKTIIFIKKIYKGTQARCPNRRFFQWRLRAPDYPFFLVLLMIPLLKMSLSNALSVQKMFSSTILHTVLRNSDKIFWILEFHNRAIIIAWFRDKAVKLRLIFKDLF